MTTANIDNSTLILARVPMDHPVFVSRVTDWTDRQSAHRAIMSLFPMPLSGDERTRRSASSILYRVEDDCRSPHVLLQSAVGLLIDTEGNDRIATTDLTGLVSRLVPDTAVRFRLDVNAVRCQARTGRRIPVPELEIPEWLGASAMSRGLSSIAVSDLSTVVLRSGATPLRVARVDGTAVVGDPAALVELLCRGIGRAKSYGCGLLTVVPTDFGA